MTEAQGYFIISALFAIVATLYKDHDRESKIWWLLFFMFFNLGCFFTFYK